MGRWGKAKPCRKSEKRGEKEKLEYSDIRVVLSWPICVTKWRFIQPIHRYFTRIIIRFATKMSEECPCPSIQMNLIIAFNMYVRHTQRQKFYNFIPLPLHLHNDYNEDNRTTQTKGQHFCTLSSLWSVFLEHRFYALISFIALHLINSCHCEMSSERYKKVIQYFTSNYSCGPYCVILITIIIDQIITTVRQRQSTFLQSLP